MLKKLSDDIADEIDIAKTLNAIIAQFKSGKDVTKQLVELRSGGNSIPFQEYINRMSEEGSGEILFLYDLEEFPIEPGERPTDYYSLEELQTDLPEQKLKNLKLDGYSNYDYWFEYWIIDDVILSAEGALEGKTGHHYYNLKLTRTLSEAFVEYKGKYLVLDSTKCYNYTHEELIEIWDAFTSDYKSLPSHQSECS